MDFEFGTAISSLVDTEIDGDIKFNGEKILVADDNDTNLDITRMIFEEVGLSIDTSDNGKGALELFLNSEENFYKIILLDIDMYGMDGCDAAKAIRECGRGDGASVPIYALTAYSSREYIRKARDAGMTGYLTKPVNYPELFSLMKKEFDK